MGARVRETMEVDFGSKSFSFERDLDDHLVMHSHITCRGIRSEKDQVN